MATRLRLGSTDCGQLVTSTKRALLLAFIFLVAWLYYKSLFHKDEQKHHRQSLIRSNSREDAIFDLIHYDHAQMQFNDDDIAHNETGFDENIVPDIVHYIVLENPYIDFVTLISILSTVRHHQPKLILVHSDLKALKGRYWDKLVQLNASQSATIIKLNRIKRPKYIFGKKLSSIFHAGDIARMKVLQTYGGIYLDNDVYVVKSLHSFRKFEFAIGWPEHQFLGTQVLICHRNARFLKRWYESYRQYRPTAWYFNAGELPTSSILEKQPSLVHRVKSQFGVHYLLPLLYQERYPFWQKEFYTVHLLSRHRSHSDGIVYFDEDNIRDYNRTFGEMARLAYYGSKEMIH